MRIAIRILTFTVAFPIALLAFTVFIKSLSKVELNNAVRASMEQQYGTKFVQLEQGYLAYKWYGDPANPVVLMIHGFSTPSFVFQENVPALVEAGYSVVTFDHFGRGLSDRPAVSYDANLYESEIQGLLKALDINQKIHLIGYSMGGGVATVFASRNPKLLKSLTLVAPIGFMPPAAGSAALIKIPIIGSWLMEIVGIPRYQAEYKAEVQAKRMPESFLTLFNQQIKYPGYAQALASSSRNFIYEDLGQDYHNVHLAGLKTHIIWGTADSVVPYAGARQATEKIPEAQFTSIAGADHGIPYTETETFNRTMIQFLNDTEAELK